MWARRKERPNRCLLAAVAALAVLKSPPLPALVITELKTPLGAD